MKLHIYTLLFSSLILFNLPQVNADESIKIDEASGKVAVPGATIGRFGDEDDTEEYNFSAAEKRLWLEDHLKNITGPTRLYYEFIKTGSYEDGFSDAVYLDILSINEDGTKNAALEFFTSDRNQPASRDNLSNISGNPVLGIYMQGDVYEMNRLTSGSWRYFQRRLKFAFADTARIEKIKIDFNGKTIAGEKISIAPYVDDPRKRQFMQFAEKQYDFIFSQDVPGTLYQIKTVVPDNSGKDREPLIQELLTLKSVELAN